MSERALKLIAKNKKTKAKFLYLGKCGLEKVPAEIGELTWLECLSLADGQSVWNGADWDYRPVNESKFSNSRLTDITALASITSLKILYVSGKRVSTLAPLSGLTALQKLDIFGTGISDLAPLSSLTSLRALDLRNTRASDLSPLSGLTALQILNLYGLQVSNLAPLSGLISLQSLHVGGGQLSNLAPLSGLTALQTLNVRHTKVSDLAPLSNLTALQTLDIGQTRVSTLAPLASLTALQTLDVGGTKVSDLIPLSGLTALHTLDIGHTQVSDLTPLSRLTALQILDVSGSPVSDLSPLQPLFNTGIPLNWSYNFMMEIGIFVSNCPITIPPIEIVQAGTSAVLNYFHERATGEVDHLFEAKMLILGEGGAGKTSLLRRLYQTNQLLPEENETTKGIDIHRHDFSLPNGQNFRLNVWDFGGQEIYHATHQFFLTKRSLYLLLDDTRKDHKSASDPGFKYWLDLIDLYGGHSPVLLFQNEKGNRSKEIDFASIKGLYDNVKERYHGNLKHPDSADQLRTAIEWYASKLPHIGEELPAAWIKVRADIEARATEKPHITQQEYFNIHAKHRDNDHIKALYLSQYLHDLGVFLHFQHDPLLARIVILQNRWATDAVYRILDDETVKKARGRFTHADCARAWHDATYVDMHPELLALMENFELCYLLPDSASKTWLAPQLLPAPKHIDLTNWNKADDLVLRYHYTVLPKGIISRMMVRLHRFVAAPEKASVNCLLFERETTQVLIELQASGNEIELRARGPERRALLSVISADLDAINAKLPGLQDKVGKWIPCHCKDCKKSAKPTLFEEKLLRRRFENSRLTVECPLSYEEVDVVALLDGIRANKLPRWAQQRTVKIFLASSAELVTERDQFELYFRQQNDIYRKQGFYLEIVRWENFFDAMSKTRSQDEYNKALRGCDVFLSLFFTKTGKFTHEEFDAAHGQFKATNLPFIFTYFKHAEISTANLPFDDLHSLQLFKDKLKALEHYPGSYTSIEDLQKQFQNQLVHVLKKIG
jgi:Leucine-rich repeat (LRR) protein